MNTIMVIRPYIHAGVWVFDDPAVGLLREPFVGGVPEMIRVLTQDLPGAARGFRLTFSAGPFPGSQACLERAREDMGGNWYRWPEQNLEGWLCPAMFKYFAEAPPRLYLRADADAVETIAVPRIQVERLLRLLEAGELAEAEELVRAVLE